MTGPAARVGTTIEPIDWSTASAADVQALHRLDSAIERDAGLPEALIPPLEAYDRYLRLPRPFGHRRSFVVRDETGFAAAARCQWEDVEWNRDHVWLSTLIPADRRGGPLERDLLATVVEVACDEFSARLLDYEERLESPAMSFLAEIGFEVKLRTPCNVLLTRDLDRRVLTEWIAKAAERASEYELVRFDGPCPEDLVGDYVELRKVMNTAPLEDLDWDDEELTVEQLRELETWDRGREAVPWVLIARHVPTRELAGFTVIIESPLWPSIAWQGDTGVRPEHRNRGLGRWLKASNALRLLDERPDVEVVTTWNAGSNEPMLAINYAMGFAPLEWWGELQAEAKTVRERLED